MRKYMRIRNQSSSAWVRRQKHFDADVSRVTGMIERASDQNIPRQLIEARKLLPERPVRAGSVDRAVQAPETGASRTRALDRSGQGSRSTRDEKETMIRPDNP